jgi:hypothetical protein
MRRVLLVALTLLLVAPLTAQDTSLPPACLWVQEGRVQFQGDLKVPQELLAAEHVGMLRPLGRGLLLWTVEQRDDTENFVQFSLSLANLRTGENHRFFKILDPFGIGTAWYLQRAELKPSGQAVLLRVRLAGTGGFINVYKLMLEPPYYWYELPEETDVWDSAAADGSVRARPTWDSTPDWRSAPTEREGRYGTVVVAGKSTPQGRKLWEVKSWRETPPYAQTDLTSAAVSPDGRQVAFTNPQGLWLAAVQGGDPLQLMPEDVVASAVCENPVWSADGQAVYVSVVKSISDVSIQRVDIAQPGQAQRVRDNAKLLCLPAM